MSVATVAVAQTPEENAGQAMDELSQMEAAQTSTNAVTPTEIVEPEPVAAEAEEATPEPAAPKAEEVAPVEEKPAEKEVASEPAPAPAPAPGAGESESEGAIVKTEVAAEVEKETKPWKVNAGLSQNLGAGAFVQDEFARTTAYSYSISFAGSYKINDTFRASLGGSFDQQLTTTYDDGGTIPNEFYFRDITVGVSAGNLYKEEFTGIGLSASGSFSIPTSKASIASERITYATGKLSFARSFDDIGPGKLSLSFSSSGGGVIGPAIKNNRSQSESPSIFARCDDFTSDGAECLGYLPNVSHAFSNTLSVSYSFLEDFSLNAWFGIANIFYRNLSDSNLDNIQYDVRSSDNAVDENQRADSVKTGLEFGYTLTENISLALSGATSTNPFIQKGDDSTGLRFFLWDVESTASNRSSLNFDIKFSY